MGGVLGFSHDIGEGGIQSFGVTQALELLAIQGDAKGSGGRGAKSCNTFLEYRLVHQ